MYKVICIIKKNLLLMLVLMASLRTVAQVDYSVVYVNEESGIEFTRITSENDYVCMPNVTRRASSVSWLTIV